mmetsp:Transcript_14644/g.37598  ORF Transcript_14644/g.37598 Transcript_14644/m.37598 type:complete len:163 (+) Transcript_14644:1-489(+)
MEDDVGAVHPDLGRFLCAVLDGTVAGLPRDWEYLQLSHNAKLMRLEEPLRVVHRTSSMASMYLITREAAAKLARQAIPVRKKIAVDLPKGLLRDGLQHTYMVESTAATQAGWKVDGSWSILEDSDNNAWLLETQSRGSPTDCAALDAASMVSPDLLQVLPYT